MNKVSIDKSRFVEVYKKMLLARRFEEKCAQAYGMGLIAGFCHLYIGQEAVAVGVYESKQPQDQVVTSYRDHVQIILAGTHPKYVMAELFGKATGCSKGKGGSMHLFDIPNKFFGGHGIVGAQVSIGTGLAFANNYNSEKAVCVTFFGDGAAHQGQVYESFNMAKLWNLPVIYIIENNEYAMGTSVKRASSVPDLYKRGESFGIPSKQVNGMDVFAVKSAMDEAFEYCRSGKGPMLLEMKTYRYRGHSMSDPAKYRTKEELENYKENKDPIINFTKYLVDGKYITQNQLEDIENEVLEIVNESFEFAKDSPLPSAEELFTEVFI